MAVLALVLASCGSGLQERDVRSLLDRYGISTPALEVSALSSPDGGLASLSLAPDMVTKLTGATGMVEVSGGRSFAESGLSALLDEAAGRADDPLLRPGSGARLWASSAGAALRLDSGREFDRFALLWEEETGRASFVFSYGSD